MSAVAAAGAERRRRLALLVLVLAALAALLIWTFGRPAAPAAATSNTDVRVQASAGVLTRPEPVLLADLEVVPDPPEPGRNPFGFGVRPPPPLPPPPPRSETPPPTSAPPVPQGPPPIALRLVGTMKVPDGRTMATLKDPATNIVFQAFEGEVVDGRYRVSKVSAQSVVVSYVDGSGTRTLRIGG